MTTEALKVYDCFMFSYSPDLLEIRLNILNDVVDKFVIVESPYGFDRNFKGLVFAKEENLKRFEKFLHKIEYVIVFDMPPYQRIDGEHPDDASFRLESFNRNAIARGLKDVSENDIVLISDFDEIPNPKMIKEYKNSNAQNSWSFTLPLFWYKMNCMQLGVDPEWPHTIMFRGRLLNQYTPQELRFLRDIDSNDLDRIYHGGWHFSWVGDEKFINEKLDGYAHQEFKSEEGRKGIANEVTLRENNSIVNNTVNVPVDSFFPKYLVDNQEKYSHLISKAVVNQSGNDLKNKTYKAFD
jgi:beta-1,4-mannosyl-glycoprotein beta-1,4-N-acetylglucosaminyltransferase